MLVASTLIEGIQRVFHRKKEPFVATGNKMSDHHHQAEKNPQEVGEGENQNGGELNVSIVNDLVISCFVANEISF